MKERNGEEDHFYKCQNQVLTNASDYLTISEAHKGVEDMCTLCFLRECRACLMVSYSSPCSASVMARQEESVFKLSSFIAAQRKELRSKGEDGACLA